MQRLAQVLLWAAVARAGLPALTTTESSTKTSSTKTSSTKTTSSSSTSSSSSSSSSSSTSTSYTFTAEVPSEMSPWVQTDSDTRGTVFIAVGAVLFAGLLLFACWRAVCHLRSWMYAKQTDKEKIYQYNSGGDAESSMFTTYDASVFQKGGYSANNSYFDGDSTLGMDHRSVYSFHSNMDDVTSQGRTLKNALTNNSTTLNNMPRTRASYISPINEIMKQQLAVNLQPPMSAHSDSSFTFPPSSASTPRAIQQHDILAEHSFESVPPRQGPYGTLDTEPAKPAENNRHKRPPSVVLDELLNDKFDL